MHSLPSLHKESDQKVNKNLHKAKSMYIPGQWRPPPLESGRSWSCSWVCSLGWGKMTLLGTGSLEIQAQIHGISGNGIEQNINFFLKNFIHINCYFINTRPTIIWLQNQNTYCDCSGAVFVFLGWQGNLRGGWAVGEEYIPHRNGIHDLKVGNLKFNLRCSSALWQALLVININ